ncbi:MAG: HNH endonuclease [Clostridia bacterium]|nr:HNH endonuclease [Clostridia bacterium]
MEKEIWKEIRNYEGLYMISSYGKVKSLGNNKTKKEKILKPQKNKNGYLKVCLYSNGKMKQLYVHRLVAEAFIPNPNNLTQLNHKSEIKTQNNVDNLEWCTYEYNNNYGTRNKRMSQSLKGEKNGMYGKHHSEKSIRKMSEAKKGEKNPNYGKRWSYK